MRVYPPHMRTLLILSLLLAACGDDDTAGDSGGEDARTSRDASGDDASGESDVFVDASDASEAPDVAVAVDAGAMGPVVDRTDPMLYEHELDPEVLDPSVVDSIETQYAQLDTRVEPLGKLVFFLSGANNTPRSWRDHGRLLAGYGFHVVMPHYNNRWGAGCSGMPGDCNANTRWEALTGEDVSPVIVASRADSAEGRVIAMLEHLVSAHPGGDWGYYLNADGTLRDSEIIIAGISHGASSTGLFASRRAFVRAVMHSGGWGSVGDSPATPISAFYGLSHTDDEQHAGHLMSWSRAGMVGSPTSIDGSAAPYGDARQLITSVGNDYPHCSVVVHGSSPREGESYVFEPAWRYLYGVDSL